MGCLPQKTQRYLKIFLVLGFVELFLLIILIKKIPGFLGKWLRYCQNTENPTMAQRGLFLLVCRFHSILVVGFLLIIYILIA
jgi:hypothetical protein